jgi:hypothetical protein
VAHAPHGLRVVDKSLFVLAESDKSGRKMAGFDMMFFQRIYSTDESRNATSFGDVATLTRRIFELDLPTSHTLRLPSRTWCLFPHLYFNTCISLTRWPNYRQSKHTEQRKGV